MGLLLLAVLLVQVAGRLCNVTNPADLPFTTGCDFCDETINATSGQFSGCYNNGQCYRQVGHFFFSCGITRAAVTSNM